MQSTVTAFANTSYSDLKPWDTTKQTQPEPPGLSALPSPCPATAVTTATANAECRSKAVALTVGLGVPLGIIFVLAVAVMLGLIRKNSDLRHRLKTIDSASREESSQGRAEVHAISLIPEMPVGTSGRASGHSRSELPAPLLD